MSSRYRGIITDDDDDNNNICVLQHEIDKKMILRHFVYSKVNRNKKNEQSFIISFSKTDALLPRGGL
jgi:hypothetical protein